MSWVEFITSLEIGLIYGIVAVGIYLTFRVIDFPDLTCDGSFVCGAATSAIAVKSGIAAPTSLIFALLAGGLSGMATGFLNTRFKVSNLLSGILVAFMLYSINLKIMGGVPNLTLSEAETGFLSYAPLLILAGISLFIWAAISYFLATNLGLALRSIGQNQRLAEIMGVNITTMTILGLTLSNALIGLGGGLLAHHEGFTDISIGFGTVIFGLAAVIIGEKIFPQRSLWSCILACFAGSIFYRFLTALALHTDSLGLETSDLNLITGISIVLIMGLPTLRGKHA